MDFSFLLQPGSYLRLFHVLLFGWAVWGIAKVHIATHNPYEPITADNARLIRRTHWRMVVILGGLWVTGALLIWNAWNAAPNTPLWTVPKIQFEIAVVAVLTANAVLIHRYLIHELSRPGFVLGQMPWRFQARAVLLGANSMTSWGTAIMLGFAREWNFLARIPELVALYGAGFALLVMVGGGHLFFAHRRWRRRYPIPLHERVQPLPGFDEEVEEAERMRRCFPDTVYS